MYLVSILNGRTDCKDGRSLRVSPHISVHMAGRDRNDIDEAISSELVQEEKKNLKNYKIVITTLLG